MCRDSKSSFEITQYVCKTQGHLEGRERGMGGELEFTNSWRAGIEVGVCRCKSCIIRVKVSSWVVKPRTHGHCVPLTLSLKAQNPNALGLLRRSPLVNCNLQLRKWKIILKLSPPDKNFIHFIRWQINFQSKITTSETSISCPKIQLLYPKLTELDFWKRQKGFQNWLFTLSEFTIFVIAASILMFEYNRKGCICIRLEIQSKFL